MTHPQHFLFAMCVVGSVQTMFYNFKQTLAKRPGIRSSWLTLTDEPDRGLWTVVQSVVPQAARHSLLAWWRMRGIRRGLGQVDAAYILDRGMGRSVWGIGRRIPFVLSTDTTPALTRLLRDGTQRMSEVQTPGVLPLSRAIARKAYLRAFRILPWSTAVKDSLIRDYGIPEDRITVLSPGINLRLWSAPERSPADDAQQPFTVLHVGIDFAGKGGDLVLRLAGEEEFRDHEFHCVTPQRIDPVPANVVVHGDLKPNSEALRKVYRQADVLVLPSRAETFSLVVLEAMASALPVVAFDTGSMRDLVEDGRTGFLVPQGDVEGIRDRLRLLRRDPELRIRMGRDGRARAESYFDFRQHVDTIMNLLQEASRSRSGELSP